MEMLVVLAISTFLLIMSYNMLEDAARTSMFVEVRNDLPVFAQTASNAIQSEAFQAKTIFDSDAAGLGPSYLAIVNLPPAFPLLQDSKMPLINSAGDLLPDTAAAPLKYTGNCLLMVRQLEPIKLVMPAGAGGGSLLIERYQFEFFYLTKRLTKGFRQENYYIDLMRGRGPIFSDYIQLTSLTAAQQLEVNTQLAVWKDPPTQRTVAITRAWNPNALTIASAFYDMKLSPAYYTAVAQPKIDMTPTSLYASYYWTESLLKGLKGRISGLAEYSIAFRPGGGVTQVYPLPNDVPAYAVFDPTKFLFPSGMEFLIVGPAGSRRVLTRVVLMASYNVREITSREVMTITAAR
jgi:hypothetical protein